MTTETQIATRPRRTSTAIIDCDIHPELPAEDSLDPFLPARWVEYRKTYGARGFSGVDYPRLHPRAARYDSWPPSGMFPGTDLGFMREQLLDEWNIETGILNLVRPNFCGVLRNTAYSAALARATNDWQIAEWLEPEPRLRASLVVDYENPDAAVEEIHRVGDHPGFVQVMLVSRTNEPLGRPKYWKMYEAAIEHQLPIGVHFGAYGGHATTAAGYPSFYIEDHGGNATAFQDQVVSLICEGVFERFPDLKFVMIEGGFAWLLPLMWRLDRAWRLLRTEVPHLPRQPSEYIRSHIWFTTQPIEEPERPEQLLELFEELDMNDRFMFATDYPHWDFDAPDQALPPRLPAAFVNSIMGDNARALYGFGSRAS